MGNTDNKGDFMEIWGQRFNLTKKGLDEEQIVPFVNSVIEERDRLRQHEEHFASLTKLAERTVMESDRLADEIRKEAANKGKTEAETLVTQAKEEAHRIAEEKRAEIVAIATEEAKSIKVDAEREARLLVQGYKEKIEPELNGITKRVYEQLLARLDDMKREVTGEREEFEQRLPQLMEAVGQVAVPPEQDKNALEVSSVDSVMAPVMDSAVGTGETPLLMNDKDEPSGTDTEIVTAGLTDGDLYDGEVEIKILPPINVMQIIGLTQHLDGIAEIESTELIPLHDRPSIIAAIREPLKLLDILSELPEVESVSEGGEADETDDPAQKARRQIQLKFYEKRVVLNETNEELNGEVFNVMSDSNNSVQ